MIKTCTKCNIEKTIENFHKKSASKDGYRSNCKSCSSEYNKNRKEKSIIYNKEYQLRNKESIKENKKKYYLDNIDYFKEKNKKNRLNIDPEKKKEYQKKYYNKPETKEKVKEYRSNRYNSDPLYKLMINIRKRISESFRSEKINKKIKSEIILGCSFLEFRIYIEKQFVEGMSWENYGEWHLDHKTPVSWGKSEEEIYILNHYTNFQPLWASDNLSKGNRYKSD